ncbi:MAG: GNAT family N-acetyltransferase [Chloroflexota bacterium]
MPVTITTKRPDTPTAIQLITELEGVLSPLYPDESRHGYSVDKLIKQGVAFFIVYVDGEAAGCGGVQFFREEGYAELKRMYIRPAYRGRGLSKQLLAHLEDHTRKGGLQLLRLETGIHQHAAIGLYERVGFSLIGPFGDYTDDPNSLYYEKRVVSLNRADGNRNTHQQIAD